MRQTEIKTDVTYHNGLTGNRSYSSRKVVGKFQKYGYAEEYVEYVQIAGRYKGEKCHLSLQSFAQWAKGVVTDETD